MLELHIGRSSGRSNPSGTYQLVVKNGNFTFLLLELILTDHLSDITPQVQTSSGQEWQYEIATVRAHIGRLTDISSSGQEWHFHISTVRAHIGRSLGRSNPPGMGN